MAQPTQAKARTKAEQEAQQKALRRAEQANILAGVRPLLEENEQLLAFARSRVAGGWRGKLNVGPEAFFAPYTNVALTERRFLVQHVHHTNGKPSEMLPHSYALGMIARVTFTDIETYGGEPACRLVLHLENGLYVRLRLRGRLNFDSAKTMAKLFDTLTVTRKPNPLSPTQSACPACSRILDMAYKFCPYCGTQQPQTASNAGPIAQTGLTLATEETEAVTAASSINPQSDSQSTIDNRQSAIVPQETDFAYERGDRPAEFGIALPLPERAWPEAEQEAAPAETGLSREESAGRPEEAADTAMSRSDPTVVPIAAQGDEQEPFMDLSVFTPDEAEEAQGPGAMAWTSEEEQEVGSQEQATDVEFGQYDAQPFAELPITTTSAGADEALSEARFGGSEEADAIVRDDETEAFLPLPFAADAPATADAEVGGAGPDTALNTDTTEPEPTNDATQTDYDSPSASPSTEATPAEFADSVTAAPALPAESRMEASDTSPAESPTATSDTPPVPENTQQGSLFPPAFPPSDDHLAGESQP